MMLPLEIKQSGGKLLPHLVLRGGVFLGEASCKIHREMKLGTGNRRERDHWGDLDVDGWIILGWISKRWDVGMWTGLDWPRIRTGGGRL